LREYIAASCLLTASEMTNAYVDEGNNTADLNGSGLTVVFIDCTWYQVHKVATDPRLRSKFYVFAKLYQM